MIYEITWAKPDGDWPYIQYECNDFQAAVEEGLSGVKHNPTWRLLSVKLLPAPKTDAEKQAASQLNLTPGTFRAFCDDIENIIATRPHNTRKRQMKCITILATMTIIAILAISTFENTYGRFINGLYSNINSALQEINERPSIILASWSHKHR